MRDWDLNRDLSVFIRVTAYAIALGAYMSRQSVRLSVTRVIVFQNG